jgi:thioredoxin-related protein
MIKVIEAMNPVNRFQLVNMGKLMLDSITMKRPSILLIAALISSGKVLAQEWQYDWNSALNIAAKEDKPIVLVFQGSDWCSLCIRLDREVWSTEWFSNYAKSHYVMLSADFPRKKANALSQGQADNNAVLAEKYNVNGIFPLVVIFDKNGKILGQTGYKNASPEEYVTILNSFIH